MTTTDTTALQERIARALYEEDKRDAANAGLAFDSDAAWEWARDWTAAVLPIIAAEMQAASEKAWGEGVAAWRDYESGLDPRLGHPRRDTPLNPYRATETGDRT